MQSKKGRLEGVWELEEIKGDRNIRWDDDAQITFEFEKDGDFSIEVDATYSFNYGYGYQYQYTWNIEYAYNGEWDWENKKRDIEIDYPGRRQDYRMKNSGLKMSSKMNGDLRKCNLLFIRTKLASKRCHFITPNNIAK